MSRASPSSQARPPGSPKLDSHLLRIAAVVVLGSFMSILDTTIVNVAIKDLSRTLQAPLTTTQWIATGYMLALATVIPLTGWAADRFGTKRLYMASILLFVLGSGLSGLAWSAPTLILFRVLQGFGGGMIMPAGMTILTHAAGPPRIGRMMGIVGVPMLLAPIVGPILGGWLVDDFSWRWIFFVNVPIGVISLYAANRILEEEEPQPQHALDWRGLLLLSPGLALFVYGLATTAAAGDFHTVGGLCGLLGGGFLVAAFIMRAWRSHNALIDVHLFRRRTVGAAALTICLFGAAFFGSALMLPLYFQFVRGASALTAGLLLAPQGAGAMISMPFASRMTDTVGAPKVVLVGLTLVAAGMLSLSQIGSATPLWVIEITLFVIGMGLGSTMMPAMSAALATLRRHEVARATSGLNVIQQAGGSVGTALLSVILAHRMSRLSPILGHGKRALHSASPVSAALPTHDVIALGRAFGGTFLWSFGIIVLAIVVALFLPHSQRQAVMSRKRPFRHQTRP